MIEVLPAELVAMVVASDTTTVTTGSVTPFLAGRRRVKRVLLLFSIRCTSDDLTQERTREWRVHALYDASETMNIPAHRTEENKGRRISPNHNEKIQMR